MHTPPLPLRVLLATMLGLLAPAAAPAQISPEARAVADAVSKKLSAAPTVAVTARHRISPGLHIGAAGGSTPIELTVQRPNRFHAIQNAGPETRELAYDGRSLCLLYPKLGHHAIEPLRADSIEEFADRALERFGFRPPVAELLANDVAAQLFRDADSARVFAGESVGWTRCDRLHIEQQGLTGDLWVGAKDRLPRRFRLTFTDQPGNPTWDIRLSNWKLGAPVDEALFSKRPPAGSQRAPLFKSR